MTVILDALSEHLDNHLNGFAEFTTTTRWEAHDSTAPYELERKLAARQYGPGEAGRRRRRDWTADEIERALTIGSVQLSVCAQMLDGVLACLRSHDVLFPLAPIVRSLEERLGLIGWVLDTGQTNDRWSIRDRVARVVLADIDDLTHSKSAAIALQAHPKDIQRIVTQSKAARAKPATMFFPSEVEQLNGGDYVLRGRPLPSVSNLNAHIAAGLMDWNHEGVYRWLSNATHPTFSDALTVIGIGDDGGPRWTMREPHRVSRLVRASLVSFGMTWELLCSYLGHPITEVRRLQHAFDDDPRLGDH